MSGAAFDPLTPKLIKILNFSHFYQKEHEKIGVYSYSRQIKNNYRCVIASFSKFWTIWFKPAAPGLNIVKLAERIFDPGFDYLIFIFFATVFDIAFFVILTFPFINWFSFSIKFQTLFHQIFCIKRPVVRFFQGCS